MPKTRRFIPFAQQELEDELRSRYGGMMTKRQIGLECGRVNNCRWQYRFVSDLRPYGEGSWKRYKVSDVAAKLYATM